VLGIVQGSWGPWGARVLLSGRGSKCWGSELSLEPRVSEGGWPCLSQPGLAQGHLNPMCPSTVHLTDGAGQGLPSDPLLRVGVLLCCWRVQWGRVSQELWAPFPLCSCIIWCPGSTGLMKSTTWLL
jgi:hypothetical protein